MRSSIVTEFLVRIGDPSGSRSIFDVVDVAIMTRDGGASCSRGGGMAFLPDGMEAAGVVLFACGLATNQ